ncbi:MAG: hypothetical protein IPL59_23720 [Candidatus Competibacteraceae bacterium]|nr:hypothetical protein [Candidatus Competibacteraceae bacterium]
MDQEKAFLIVEDDGIIAAYLQDTLDPSGLHRAGTGRDRRSGGGGSRQRRPIWC